MSKPVGTIRNCLTNQSWDGTGYLVPSPYDPKKFGSSHLGDYFTDEGGQVWERVHNLATAKYLEEKNNA